MQKGGHKRKKQKQKKEETTQYLFLYLTSDFQSFLNIKLPEGLFKNTDERVSSQTNKIRNRIQVTEFF